MFLDLKISGCCVSHKQLNIEIKNNSKLPFLDVLVTRFVSHYQTFFFLCFHMPFRTLLKYPTKINSSAFCTYVENSEKFNFFQKSSKAMGQKIHQFNERVTRHRISKKRIISSYFYAIHMYFGDIRPRLCGWRWRSNIKKLGIVEKSVLGSHGEQFFFAIVKGKGSEKMRTIVICGWAWMTKGAEIHKCSWKCTFNCQIEIQVPLPPSFQSVFFKLLNMRNSYN